MIGSNKYDFDYQSYDDDDENGNDENKDDEYFFLLFLGL